MSRFYECLYVLTGMAGAQILSWFLLDSEIKTAGLKNVRGSPSVKPHMLIIR